MEISPETQEKLQQCQRDINCLLDKDRNLRKTALMSLKNKLLGRLVSPKISKQIYEQYLLKNLLHCISDPIDFIRERSIKLNIGFFEKLENIDTDSVHRLIEVLISRVNTIPFQETSEEVRLLIVEQIRVILEKYPSCFHSNMGGVCTMVSKLLMDKYPAVKKDLSALIELFCKELGVQIGLNASGIIKSLVLNTQHQHSRVRKAALKAMRKLLVVPQGGECFDISLSALKRLMNDKSSDVRKELYGLVADCIQSFTYPDLKQFEPDLVLLLISGLNDPKPEIRKSVTASFEVCGKSRKALEERMSSDIN